MGHQGLQATDFHTFHQSQGKKFNQKLTQKPSVGFRTQMNGAMENLKKVSGSELLTKAGDQPGETVDQRPGIFFAKFFQETIINA